MLSCRDAGRTFLATRYRRSSCLSIDFMGGVESIQNVPVNCHVTCPLPMVGVHALVDLILGLRYYTSCAPQRLSPLLVSGFYPRKAALGMATSRPASCGALILWGRVLYRQQSARVEGRVWGRMSGREGGRSPVPDGTCAVSDKKS